MRVPADSVRGKNGAVVPVWEDATLMKIILDPTKCVGCRTCEAVCSLVNEGEANPTKSRIKVVRTIDNGLMYPIPVLCQQCERASCAEVCPARAITRNGDGVLIVNEKKCLGCSACTMACPFGAIAVHPEKRVASKCTQCADFGGEPQCVKHCFPQALRFIPAERAGITRARAKTEKLLQMTRRA